MVVHIAMFFGPSHCATCYPCHGACMWKSGNCKWTDFIYIPWKEQHGHV